MYANQISGPVVDSCKDTFQGERLQTFKFCVTQSLCHLLRFFIITGHLISITRITTGVEISIELLDLYSAVPCILMLIDKKYIPHFYLQKDNSDVSVNNAI